MNSAVTLSYTVRKNQWFSLLSAGGALFLEMLLFIKPGFGAEFERSFEKDFSIKSVGQFRIVNAQGDISVQGWALDKIRVKVTKGVTAQNEGEAEAQFKKLEYRYEVVGPDVEIHSQYGNDLNLTDRMQMAERGNQKIHYTVMAPSYLRLKLWTSSGRVSVKGWNKDLEMRTNSGPIRAESVRADKVLAQCLSCPIDLKNMNGEVRAISNLGPIQLSQIHGPSIFAESEDGAISSQEANGSQAYQTKTGAIRLSAVKGEVVAISQSGALTAEQKSGLMSLSSDSGVIQLSFGDSRLEEKSTVTSKSGSIFLHFLPNFGAEVDLQTKNGTLECLLPFQSFVRGQGESLRRLYGRIGSGGPFLSVSSESGKIEVAPRSQPGGK